MRLVVDRQGHARWALERGDTPASLRALQALCVPHVPSQLLPSQAETFRQPVRRQLATGPWVPPARRSAWNGINALLAVGVMIGALAGGGWADGRLQGAMQLLPPWPAWMIGIGGVTRVAPTADGASLPEGELDIAADVAEMTSAGLDIALPPAASWIDLGLELRLTAAIPRSVGAVAVYAQHLPTGATAAVNARAAMPPASVYKLGVLLEVFNRRATGTLSLGERLWLTPDDWAEGAGVLQNRIGDAVSVAEAVRLMTGMSDNVAALALMRRLGPDAVNAEYQRIGLSQTHLYADDRPDVTTAAETASLLFQLVTGQLDDEDATRLMLRYLAQDQPAAWIRQGLPAGALVAHKSGQLPGTRNDAAIVYAPGGPYILVVLTDRLSDDAAGEQMIGSIARTVDDYFAEVYPPGVFTTRG